MVADEDWTMWFVTADPSGRFAARAMAADPSGGHQVGDDLHADTLDTLRAMLPAGLTRRDRTMMMMMMLGRRRLAR